MNGETIMAFQARAARRMEEHDARIRAPLERQLKRAKRALALSRLTLTMERQRARDAIDAVRALREESRSRQYNSQHTAIVAMLRVERALGVIP